ncbi:hypothetical protein D9M69_450660 [compost metagenome]
MIPPCGVPASVAANCLRSTTPALNHFLSIILSMGTFLISQSWLMLSKNPFMSPSITQVGATGVASR